ncbi:NAD(P)-dependent dehydrogenase (short-subunit alcohol dehydrogenase family) [Rhodopirellula rubra]|uniref:NAD(P)-dependent dehydrogenase (Short-subunit alcohol dehydrogenase family) n=1 Tax=Aporhodopirellula rubra TaxID=980271 RepID=A0A7W5H4G0_9BACT|nr:SDR family oxidoreductase [Aporhodopirellula rubra]MBB3206347.1 NAD(P)-dependent dehydrogenase (short-subunit alcohol dehydrogenase family) [Aporhodopirellula rubra]
MAFYLIVGAAGGIGSCLCRRLVADDHRVMMLGRDESKLAALADELKQPFAVCDASDWDRLAEVTDQAIEEFGTLDGAVNLAGSILLKPAHLTSKSDLQNVIEQNLVTAFGLIRSVAPKLKKAGGGSIVLMSSGGAAIGLTSHEAIAAAKAGVAAMARAAAATYAAGGVRINTVAPGLVKTELTGRVWQNERSAEASRAMHPLGRLGEPADIASLIAWLLSPEQTWITGQDIAVDGGLSSIKSATR